MSWEQLFLSRELSREPAAEIFDEQPYFVEARLSEVNFQTDLITDDPAKEPDPEPFEKLKLSVSQSVQLKLCNVDVFDTSPVTLFTACDHRAESLSRVTDTMEEFIIRTNSMQTLTPIGLSFCLAEMESNLEILEYCEGVVRKLSPNNAISDSFIEKLLEFKNEVVKKEKNESEYILDWMQGHADIEPEVKGYSAESLIKIRKLIGNKDLCEMSQEDMYNWGIVFQTVTLEQIQTILDGRGRVRRSLLPL